MCANLRSKSRYAVSQALTQMSLAVGAAGCVPHYLATAPTLAPTLSSLLTPAHQHAPTLLQEQWVRQQTPTSCSVAAVTTILNAARVARFRRPVLQDQVVRADSTTSWLQATRYADSPGINLDMLQIMVLRAFYAFDLPHLQVDVIHVATITPFLQQRLESVLSQISAEPNRVFILANFQQSIYTAQGDPQGHVAVVGGFDARHRRVLILDVDPDILKPYWVDFATFIQGLHTQDEITANFRGLLVVKVD